ncbi:hypothetical protein EDB89DRAFT_2073872 [Lactarius sanguifluus]|nr:hypothetical protein EDB89DRAFT_2073872 [Lactarius sanguifluus]
MSQGAHVGKNEPKLIDSSAPLFSIYNEKAKERDKKMAESWKGDAEGILVFTGLFSAAIAQLLGNSLQNLQLNPQDASNFYLARIYQLTPGSNASSIHLPDDPDSFNPPKIAIWVNILWSLSLVISLTCALLATLLQQWARRYLRITQKRNDPRKRAQIRQLMRQALKKGFRLRWMVELLPTLLHISVFLFLVGFIAYLSTFNHLVAKLAGACAIFSSALYVYISLAPIYSPGSLYSTPLTTIIWVIFMGMGSMLIRFYHFVAVRWLRPRNTRPIRELYQLYYQRVRKGLTTKVEELADTDTSLATSVLRETYEFIDGDSDMEQFLSAIPGFYSSTQTSPGLTGEGFGWFNSEPLPSLIMSHMGHVLSSNLLTDPERQNYIEICSRTITANSLLLQSTFRQTLQTLNPDIFKRADFVRLALENLRKDDSNPWVKDYAQCIVAVAMNRTHLEDGAWIDIAWHYLKPHHAQYRWPGEAHNLRLCNLIYLTQRLKDSQLEDSDRFENGGDWYIALVEARKLEVRGTALGLRLEFRALWNELVDVADNRQRSDTARQNAHRVLHLIDTVYTFM